MGQEIAKMVSFINALARRVHSGLVGHWDSLLISSIAVADEDTAIFSYFCVIVQLDKLKSVLSTLGRRLSMSAFYILPRRWPTRSKLRKKQTPVSKHP